MYVEEADGPGAGEWRGMGGAPGSPNISHFPKFVPCAPYTGRGNGPRRPITGSSVNRGDGAAAPSLDEHAHRGHIRRASRRGGGESPLMVISSW